MLRVEAIASFDGKVLGPPGLVYSTGPRVATALNGGTYYVKGPEPATVFAELAGCLLAQAAGLTVPEVCACDAEGERYAGSAAATVVGRDVAPWLRRPELCVNRLELFNAIVVDTWLANPDRNMGNLLAVSSTKGRFSFEFIDFEKSMALRESPVYTAQSANLRQFWPSGELGVILKNGRPVVPPAAALSAIRRFVGDAANVASVVQHVIDLVPVTWSEASVEVLVRRGERIDELAEGVWNLS